VERIAGDETRERLDPKRELPDCERPLVAKAARTEASQVVVGCVLGPVDDAQVLTTPALDPGLGDPLNLCHG
jgi:hypothetical protein